MADIKEFQIGSNVYKFKDETARNSISALQAAVGSPLVANTAASMTDTTKIYVYTGSETGYASGHWYYYDGSDWTDGGVYNSVAVQTDTSLSVTGVAADSAKVGSEISDLKSEISSLEAIPRSVKLAMDTLFQNMAVKDDAGYSDEYATIHEWASAINLVSISAVFDQGQNVIYDFDPLDSLRQYLTVTALYDDGTSEVVSGYTLSGELTEGTSTITVTYDGKTTTFNVIVTEFTGLPVKLGYTVDASGVESSGSNHSATDYVSVTESSSTRQITVTIENSLYVAAARCFDSSKTALGSATRVTYTSGSSTFTLLANTAFVKLLVDKNSAATTVCTASDIDNYNITVDGTSYPMTAVE